MAFLTQIGTTIREFMVDNSARKARKTRQRKSELEHSHMAVLIRSSWHATTVFTAVNNETHPD